MLRIIMLLGERLPLPGMILGAAVRQLYGGFLSGYQFTQTGDMASRSCAVLRSSVKV